MEELNNDNTVFTSRVAIENMLQELADGNQLLEGTSVQSIINFLNDSGYFRAPSSTKYVGCYTGGLPEHSINVANKMKDLYHVFDPDPTIENDLSCLKIGLFHDFYKADMYEESVKNKKVYCDYGDKSDSLGKFCWESELGYSIKDAKERKYVGNVGLKTYFELSKYIKFNTEEIEALVCSHSALNQDNNPEVINALGRNKLLTLLTMAELGCTFFG